TNHSCVVCCFEQLEFQWLLMCDVLVLCSNRHHTENMDTRPGNVKEREREREKERERERKRERESEREKEKERERKRDLIFKILFIAIYNGILLQYLETTNHV